MKNYNDPIRKVGRFWEESEQDFCKYEYYLTRKQAAESRRAYLFSFLVGGSWADHVSDELEEICCGMRLEREPHRYRKINNYE